MQRNISNVSKEAIHNRNPQREPHSVVENGLSLSFSSSKRRVWTLKLAENRYPVHRAREVRLREKVDCWKRDKPVCGHQREQMLIDERSKIEQIYKERDAQLAKRVACGATKFLSHVNEILMQEADERGWTVINVECRHRWMGFHWNRFKTKANIR